MMEQPNVGNVTRYIQAIHAAHSATDISLLKQLLRDCADYIIVDGGEFFDIPLQIIRQTDDPDLQSAAAYFLWELAASITQSRCSALLELLLHPHVSVRGTAANLLRHTQNLVLSPIQLETVRVVAERECRPETRNDLMMLRHQLSRGDSA